MNILLVILAAIAPIAVLAPHMASAFSNVGTAAVTARGGNPMIMAAGDVGGAVDAFSEKLIGDILNPILGGLIGIFAFLTVVNIIFIAAKYRSKNVEESQEAIKNGKRVLIALVVILIACTAGLTLVNTVLKSALNGGLKI